MKENKRKKKRKKMEKKKKIKKSLYVVCVDGQPAARKSSSTGSPWPSPGTI